MQRIVTGIALGIIATVLLAGGAFAATGGTFVLGRSNAASSQTLLTSSNASAPVLGLSTRSGQVPLAVSSSAGKATNLNADRVDGLDGSDLQRRVSTRCEDGLAISSVDATGGAVCSSTQDAAIQIRVGTMTGGLGSVACPAGTFPIGGGVIPDTDSGPAAILVSSPYRNSSTDSGWQGRAAAFQGSGYDGRGVITVSCGANVAFATQP